MQFLIDSANLEEVREAMKLPYILGVTTNTREVSYHSGDDIKAYLSKLREIARGTIHVQVTTEDKELMVAEGRSLAGIVESVRIKIPVTVDGLKAMECLSTEGIEVAATAVNSVTMAVLSAKAGAKSVIPYYGVLEDFETDSTSLLADVVTAFKTYGFETQLVYFARNLRQVRQGIRAGAHGCLMTLSGVQSLMDDPLAHREVAFMNSEWRRRFGEKTWATM